MGVIATDSWLLTHYENPEKICEQLREYIELPPRYLYRYLVSRGMYRPVIGGKKEIEQLRENGVWQELEKEFQELRRWLAGPDVPIFLFPSDVYNRRIQQEYDGKSGLAFRQCLFIFLSSANTIQQIKAVLTHEYHHICRLHLVEKEEGAYTLLDTMVMEGLAEAAVAERHGEKYYAPWTKYYTRQEAVRLWHMYVRKRVGVGIGTEIHEELLNGLRVYPRMLGYAIGFHLVQDCIERHSFTTRQLLTMDAQEILEKSSSFPE